MHGLHREIRAECHCVIRIAIVYESTLDCSLTLARAKSALFSTVRANESQMRFSFFVIGNTEDNGKPRRMVQISSVRASTFYIF